MVPTPSAIAPHVLISIGYARALTGHGAWLVRLNRPCCVLHRSGLARHLSSGAGERDVRLVACLPRTVRLDCPQRTISGMPLSPAAEDKRRKKGRSPRLLPSRSSLLRLVVNSVRPRDPETYCTTASALCNKKARRPACVANYITTSEMRR